MKKSFLLSATILLYIVVRAQLPTFQWADGMGGVSGDRTQQCATDTAGNVYITGYFSGISDFDPGLGAVNLSATGMDDIFVAKYDASGAYQWAFKIGTVNTDWGWDIASDATGNIYVTGYFNGTADFDPSGGTFNLTSTGGTSAYVARYNSSGVLQWAFMIGSTSGSSGAAIRVDESSVYVTGIFAGTTDFDPSPSTANLTSVGAQQDIFVAKYTATGVYQWAIAIGGLAGGKSSRGISVDLSGNVYITGYFESTVDFDPAASTANLTSVGMGDVFVAKYDSSGIYQWAFNVGGSGDDNGYGISNDATGNVYVTGAFKNTPDFDPSGATINLSALGGQSDVFVAKYSTSGQYLFAFPIGGLNSDAAYDLNLDSGYNIYITGTFRDTIDLDPSNGTDTIISAGSYDIYVAKYSSSGIYQWGFGCGGSGFDVGLALAIDPAGNLFLSGGFVNTADFDPSASTITLTSSGNWDIYVAKYCQPPSLLSTISGNTSVCVGSNNVYSVTNDPSALSYTWNLPGGWTGTSSTNSINTTVSSASGNITVTANNSCGSSAQQTLAVTVNALPNVSVTLPLDTLCVNSAAVTLSGGSPSGGVYSGTNVSSGSFNPAGTGNFLITYTVTDTNSCTDSATATIVVDACLGIDANEADLFTVYPNPTDGMVSITSQQTTGQVIIYNATGEMIHVQPLNSGKTDIDLSPYADGIYFVRLQVGSMITTKKIIKE